MAETFVALGTGERFLAGVQSAVFGQVVFMFERLGADVAGERASACGVVGLLLKLLGYC